MNRVKVCYSCRKMKKRTNRNLIIGIGAAVIIALAIILYANNRPAKNTKQPEHIFHWPEVTLKGTERITAAYVAFHAAHIRSIINIPPGWYIDLKLNVPPNPAFNGSIIVGAAALESTRKLPELEFDDIDKEEKAKAIRAEFMVTDFTNGRKIGRKIEINLSKP